MVTAALRTWAEVRRQQVDGALATFVPATGEPAIVWEAMRYSLLGGGKRLRPLLSLAAAEAIGERERLPESTTLTLTMPCACALEMIHTYSLVHDDLPAMDNDVLRRGRPTAHVAYGEGLAILAGDALLTEAFGLLAREPQLVGEVAPSDLASRKIAAIRLIADAAGARGMVGGQAIDLQAIAPGAASLSLDDLQDMHRRKTGALIRASVLAGASMSGASRDVCAALDEYGAQLGLAFQIVDDILDVEGASADLGKTAGKDAAAGKPTYPALFGLARSRTLAAECIERGLAALQSVRLAGQLPALARWVTDRHS